MSHARPLAALLAAAALALGAPACSENQPSLFEETVLRPSSVPKFLDPEPGESGVSPLPEILVGYEEELDFAKVSPAAVQLVDLGPGLQSPTAVAVIITRNADGRGFTLRPIAQLVAPRTFEVRVLGRQAGVRFVTGDDTDDFSFRFTTAADPAITTAPALPPAQAASPYAVQLALSGGTAPLLLAVTEGTLPEGLALDTATGRISGTPTNDTSPPATQTFRFAVSVMDAIGRTGTTTFTLDVQP